MTDEEYIGTFRDFIRSEEDWFVARMEDGSRVIGKTGRHNLIRGVTYRFWGKWELYRDAAGSEHDTFRCKMFVSREPANRKGVVRYLSMFVKKCGIGDVGANRLFDAFGGETILVMRTNPEAVVRVLPRLSIEQARAAAEMLSAFRATEETVLALVEIFGGTGFPRTIYNWCIERFNLEAPALIRRNPFILMLRGAPGAGFNRCDQLYLKYGGNPEALKRQFLCAYHHIRNSKSGNTWFPRDSIRTVLNENIGGATPRPEKVLRLGLRSGWFVPETMHGQPVITDNRRAADEVALAHHVRRILGVNKCLARISESNLKSPRPLPSAS